MVLSLRRVAVRTCLSITRISRRDCGRFMRTRRWSTNLHKGKRGPKQPTYVPAESDRRMRKPLALLKGGAFFTAMKTQRHKKDWN